MMSAAVTPPPGLLIRSTTAATSGSVGRPRRRASHGRTRPGFRPSSSNPLRFRLTKHPVDVNQRHLRPAVRLTRQHASGADARHVVVRSSSTVLICAVGPSGCPACRPLRACWRSIRPRTSTMNTAADSPSTRRERSLGVSRWPLQDSCSTPEGAAQSAATQRVTIGPSVSCYRPAPWHGPLESGSTPARCKLATPLPQPRLPNRTRMVYLTPPHARAARRCRLPRGARAPTRRARVLARIDIKSPFVVRTFDPDLLDAAGKPSLTAIERLGKRIIWRIEDGLLVLVFHLMIAGRFHQRKPGARPKLEGGPRRRFTLPRLPEDDGSNRPLVDAYRGEPQKACVDSRCNWRTNPS